MTNPSPRPALRKAADAEVHPAAPRPARSPRARTADSAVSPGPASSATPVPAGAVPVVVPAPAPLKPAKKRQDEAARTAKPTKRKFSGATSDHLRVPEVPEAGNGSAQRSALDALFDGDAAPAPGEAVPPVDRPRKAKAPKKSATVDLMSGKPVDLDATVPKALRKAVRDEAKRRGLDVDAVVTDLLHAWVTERR